MKAIKRANGVSGMSAGKSGGLGLAVIGLIMGIVSVIRAAGVDLPISDEVILRVLESAAALLAGLGIFGARRRMDRSSG